MLVSEIKTRVLRSFGDQFQARITDDDIIRWINDGMREIARMNDLLQVTATIPTVVGTNEYNFPVNILYLQLLTYNGQTIEYLGLKEFMNLTQDETGQVSGPPTRWTRWATKIRVYPNPSEVGDIKVYYIRTPNDVTTTADTPELPVQYHPRLVEYCLAQAAEFDEDTARYQSKMNEFKTGINEQKGNDEWEEHGTYPVISVAPGDAGGTDYGEGWWY